MVSSAASSVDSSVTGFGLAMAFYAVSLFSSIALAFYLPLADMCNPGTPLLIGVLLLGVGLLWGAAMLLLFLLGHRSGFVKGSLLAHLLVLGFVGLAFLLII
ncbi:hypothetical protein [Hymenobacter chitinivorans]|uniref:Uncharacterized protein n=1 Tax=Hymenobacter chitinivorans DSM 11115 TaxID=1121954 RepID=A0A2M9BPW5_9BACT|nr:hypothetical protein [Hymenobacter chitinivorans]PJJ59990.1 hypothetical protein CLV45_1415 [Hymenobacter chitinivorans DSM 11115]